MEWSAGVSSLFFLLLGFIVGAWIGWKSAHVTVAEECKRLGGFFVGNQVFKCIEVRNVD